MSDSDPDEVEEYDSFAQPTLIDQLKKILDEYPDDGQIIKELVQNADDAGAECMKILYTGQALNPHKQDETKYRKFLRGPALVLYNDATFSDADWTGIRTIYNSVKADDPLTVGRFGLGFKSVFHITDFPCIISNDRILFLNPLEKRSDRVCVTIKLNKLQQSKTVDVSDVLAAFNGVFGFSDITLQTGKFPGTMLWFPLRTEATRLSSNTYPEGRVLDLFKAFMADSERSLLFLKGLKSIQLYCCMGPNAVSLVKACGVTPNINFGKDMEFFSVNLDEDEQNGASSKKAFIQQVRALDGSIPDQPLYKPLSCELHIRRRQPDKTERLDTQQWFILNLYPGEPITEHLKELIGDKDLCYSPLVAVAACSEESSNFTKQRQGKIFCFQPLPDEMENRTGLPVHVNAFFALTQNRRHIKLPSADQEHFNMQVAKPIEWNKALMTEILPEAYVELILGIIELSRNKGSGTSVADMVYSIIPDMMKVNPKWTSHAEKVLALLLGKRFLYTKAGGGEWISAEEAIFALPDCLEAIQDLLLTNDVKLVLMPSHILTAIEKLIPSEGLKTVNQEYIFQFMTEDDSYKRLPFQQKIDLLHFLCDSDFKSLLNDLELIPLANGKFATLGSTDTYFIEEEAIVRLFPGLEHHFVSVNISQKTTSLFEDIARAGNYQVRKLDMTAATGFLETMMQVDFGSVLPSINIDKGKSTKWKDLLEGIWAMIILRFPEDIESFEDLPLVPVHAKRDWSNVSSFSLYPLSSLLLSKVDKDGKEMSAELCTVFELLSVNVIHSLPEWINVHVIDKYIYRYTGQSMADLIGRLNIKHVQYFNRKASNEQKRRFLTFLSNKLNADVLSETSKEIISQLELFEEITSLRSDYKLVSAQTSHGILDCKDFPIRFPEPLLRLKSKSETVFVGLLGKEKLKSEKMVLKTLRVLEGYSKEDIVTFMHWLLTNRFHEKPDRIIFNLVVMIPFLEVQGNLFRVGDLFDPSDTSLTSMFNGFSVFPTDPRFTSSKILHILKDLGLKTRRDVSCKDINAICQNLHSSGSYEKNRKTALDLLVFLNLIENFELLNKSCSQISPLKWVPVHDQYRTEELLFNNGRCTFVSPKQVRSLKYRDVVGSVLPLMDCRKFSQVAKLFNWNKNPKVDDVVAHLSTIVNNYSSERHTEYLQIVIAIYKWFDSLRAPSEVRKVLDRSFACTGFNYIWTGNGFTQRQCVIVNRQACDINLKPFRWFVPSELKHLRQFLVSLGCKDTVETMDYVNVLGEIKETCDQQTQNDSGKLLQLTISILNKIKDNVEQGTVPRNCTIYVPVQSDNLVLKPAYNCMYGNAHESVEEGFSRAHQDLAVSTAEAVGVKSFRQQMMSELEGLEEWGQTEPLTRRLHNLLMEGYVDGFSVPKELFQNADDAKASKLWILYDERDNEDARKDLLDDAMAEMQGPALWVYNDAMFTEADFRNLANLNGATKQLDTSKIGKFGLGFCSVYNLTDVPSVLSGDSIVMFDPHTQFLGKALPGKSPGLRINLRVKKNSTMLEKLRHQFLPFENIFGCTKMHEMSEYNGTLFRLPLRNKKSDISDVIYRGSEIQDLLSKIKQFSSNLLIFSQNVSEVKLFHLKNNRKPECMDLLFSSRKSIQQTRQQNVNRSILEEASRIKDENSLENHPLKTIENISVETWDCNEEFNGASNWIVSWATGTAIDSLRMTKVDRGALPLGATAIPFDDENKIKHIKDMPSCFYQRPHFFCFLPLPLEHSFPFHINGLFSVSSDRRRLLTFEEEDKRTGFQDWNESLMKDAVVVAFVYMLNNLQELLKCTNMAFYEMWPKDDKHPFNRCLFKSFYKHILDNDHPVFEKGHSWYPVSECVFLDPSLQKHPHGDIAFEILNQFSTQAVAIDLPVQYYMYLHEANKELIEEKTVGIISFILKYFLPNLSNIPSKKRNALLTYAIGLKDAEIDIWLKTHKSLPTQPNEDLRLPSEVVDKQSQLGPLFFQDEGRFLSEEFSKEVGKVRLWALGVVHDVLPDLLLVDRASTIGRLGDKCAECGIQRCKLLIEYIMKKESHYEKVWLDLQNVKFLPVARRPDKWPSKWAADDLLDTNLMEIELCRDHKDCKLEKKPVYETASSLYFSRLGDLVGCSSLVFDARACLPSRNIYIHEVEMILRQRLSMHGNKDVMAEMVLQQIVVFAESFEANSEGIDVPYVDGVMKNLYRFLNDDEKLPTLALQQGNIIWTSGMFAKPHRVAISNFGLDCSPFLFDLQKTPLLQFTKLCKALEIKSIFSTEDILGVIDEIAGQSLDQSVETAKRPVILKLLESLSQVMEINNKTYNALLDDSCTILAPDKDWILRDSRYMCFNDDSGLESDGPVIFVNEALTIKTAKSIGIKSLVTQMIHDTSDSVEFFQDEPLVTRLNNILAGYPCDSGIFKELIQNADDAGAQEIHFLIDFDTYGSDVFDQSYNCLQGPALCVFNDKPFTQNDLKGIQNLGKGSKGEDPSKTGRYGVGFNSVYNLTDAPSFLTKGPEIENGETLCIFDPMAIFLPRAFITKEKPGRRFKDVTTIRAKHKDVLPPYNESNFPMENGGTVFRFPLRSLMKRYTSEIKENSISASFVHQILSEFSREASENLIFLKNLCRLQISVKSEKLVSLEMSIEVDIAEKDNEKRASYFKRHAEMCQTFKLDRETIFSLPSLTVDYKLSISEKEKIAHKQTEYLVVQTVGYENLPAPTIIQDKFKSGELGLLPQGGVASILSVKPGTVAFKGNKPNKAFCFLPLPGETGLPVHVNGHFALDHEGRRGLWKSDKFEQTSCYKTLWNKSLIEGVVTPAYVTLLDIMRRRISTKVEGKMTMFPLVRHAISDFNALLPDKNDVVEEYWLHLLKLVYKRLVEKDEAFLPALYWDISDNKQDNESGKACLTWISMKREDGQFPAYCNDMAFNMGEENSIKRQGCIFTNIITAIGMRTAVVPRNIRESLESAGIVVEALSPTKVIKFLESHNQNKRDACLIKVNTSVEKTVVKSVEQMHEIVRYCIKDKACFQENICHIPVFITTDNQIRVISADHPVFVTKFHDFFENVEDKFLCSKLADMFLEKRKSFLQGIELLCFHIEDFKGFLDSSPSLATLDRGEIIEWDETAPSKTWLTKVWEFFNAEVENEHSDSKKTEKRVGVKKLLKMFDCTALIPAKTNTVQRFYLVPPCKLGIMMNVSSFQSGTLKNTMTRLDLLDVRKDIIEGNASKQKGLFEDVNHEVPHSKSPEKIVTCLHVNKTKIVQAKLTSSEAEAILNYLADNIDSLSNVIPKVRELPIFITCQGQLIALSDYSKYFTLQTEQIPEDGLEHVTKETRIVFLKTWKNLAKLYKTLGVVPKSAEDLYIEYIFPNQGMLNRDQFYKHIEYLSSKLFLSDHCGKNIVSTKKKKIVNMLTLCKFIETQTGRFVTPSELFSPKVEIFSQFCQQEKLLPERFHHDVYITFFELLGLQSKMTVHLFEQFAKEIALKGKHLPISQKLRDRSNRLLKIFTDMQHEIDQQGFQNLVRVPFIIPYEIPKELAIISQPFLNEERMVCFSESVFYEKLEISWTACPVLPTSVDILDRSLKCKLEAKPGSFSKLFVSHCCNIEKGISELLTKPMQKDVSQRISSVMNNIYEHLLERRTNEQKDTELIKQLTDVALVYFKDEPCLLKASETVVSCTSKEEIRPFLYKMPIELGKYSEIFQALGATEEPLVKHYIHVLHCLKEKCKHDEMLEPDLLLAKLAVGNLITCGVKSNSDTFQDDTVLYLPTMGRRMEDARSVIYCDNNYFRRRIGTNSTINYFVGHDKLEINEITEQQCLEFFRSLPERLRPVLLTDIVEDIPDSTSFRTIDNFRVRKIESFIRSTNFTRGLIRLVKHAYKDSSKSWDMTLDQRLTKKMENIRLIAVSGMKTVLEIKTFENGEYKSTKRVPNTEETKPIHFVETESSTKIYVEIAESEWQDDLNHAIAHHINSFLKDNSLRDELLFLFLSFFKHADRPPGIADMLDKRKIVSHTFTSSEEPSFYSKPGTIVPKSYHPFLDNRYGVIHKYEFNYVAYQMNDPMVDDEENTDMTATYIFARILRKLEETHTSLFDLYEIDVGENDPLQVPAYRIYRFVRQSNTTNVLVIYERQGNATDDNGDVSDDEDNASGQTTDKDEQNELSIHAVCKEIKETLIEAWKEDEVTRKKIVKRLFLKWHPDKNPNRIEFCTKVFQYIQQCLGKLAKGKQLDDYTDGTDNQQETPGQSNSSGGSRYWRGYEDDSDFWREFNERFEREQKFNRDRHGESSESGYGSRRRPSSPNFEEEREPYRWPEAAARWQKQANTDFEFALECLANTTLPTYNWICYIFHQAAEKSLRAAWYAKDANRIPGETTTDLEMIANGLVDALMDNTRQITRIITRDRRRLTHPRRFTDDIPAGTFTRTDADNVGRYAREIIKLVKENYL